MTDFAEKLLLKLKLEREGGITNKENPITADKICQAWNKKYPHNPKRSVDVRKAINELRSAGEMIGTNSGEPAGCWLCLTAEEYREMSRHLASRIVKQSVALYTPLQKAREKKIQAQEILLEFCEENPAVKTLVNEFELQVTN